MLLFRATHRTEPTTENGELPVDLTPHQAHRLVADGAVLVDVREHDEWHAGHAPGALHVPLASLHLDDVPSDAVIVAVCRSGARSKRAVAALHRAGRRAHNLAGGMHAWHRAGLRVVRDDGTPGSIA